MAGPEHTASRQPRLPQPQRGPPPATTVRWPISPASPASPRHRLPPSTRPEPMPVPMATRMKSEKPCPAPKCSSPRAWLRTSLSMATGRSRAAATGATRCTLRQSGKLGEKRAMPSFRSTSPGMPRPTPVTRRPPASIHRARASSTRLSRTAAGPPIWGVGTFSAARRSPVWSTSAALISVPPTSMPIARLMPVIRLSLCKACRRIVFPARRAVSFLAKWQGRPTGGVGRPARRYSFSQARER